MKVWVGTSGYSYKEWLGNFYPEDLSPRQMLRSYSSRLPAVEINNTFYRLPKESVLASWAEQVPTDFRFVLKAAQKITHVKRLKDAEAEVEYLFRVAAVLGQNLGGILFQLPPNLRKDLDRLKRFLSSLPDHTNVAFEFRHPSWLDDEVIAALRAHNCALCFAETDDAPIGDLMTTANWGYVRLRRSQYSRGDLLQWKKRILANKWDHAFVFFKHEDEGIGPRLGGDFLDLLRSNENLLAPAENRSGLPAED